MPVLIRLESGSVPPIDPPNVESELLLPTVKLTPEPLVVRSVKLPVPESPPRVTAVTPNISPLPAFTATVLFIAASTQFSCKAPALIFVGPE